MTGPAGSEDRPAPAPDPKSPAAATDIDPRLAPIFEVFHPGSVKGKRWVRIEVSSGGWDWKEEGWLIEDGKDSVVVLSAQGTPHTFRKPAPGERRPKREGKRILRGDDSATEPDTAWDIQSGSFPAFCKQFLKKGIPERKESDGADGVFRFFADRSEQEAVIIDGCRYAVWARQVGDNDLARNLYALASRAHKKYASTYIAEDAKDLHRLIADKLAADYRTRAISAAHSGAARAEVLKTWEIPASIPYHSERDQARTMVEGYRSLITEDKVWKEPAPEALAKMTSAQKAAYWMYHLRDADAYQTSDPGHCDVVSDRSFFSARRSEKKPNPAAELVKLGTDALPLVIAHLDDTRPTRCQGHWRSFAPDSYYLLRYCDCCQQIFEAITGRTIFESRTTVSTPANDGKEKECKARAERWWRDHQRKGEKQMLLEATRTGDSDSCRQVERLVKKYPEEAFDAITQGVRNASEGWIRTNLIWNLCKLKDPRVADFLVHELSGPHRSARVLAASQLMDRGHREGLRALIAEWKGLGAAEYDAARFEENTPFENLVSSLLHSGQAEAVDAVRTDLRKKSLYLRWHVVQTLPESRREGEKKQEPEPVRQAIDRLLVEALNDTEECDIRAIRWQERDIYGAPVGDLAATVLARRWQKPKAFDPTADFRTRRAQRVALANLWREQNGLPLLTPPPSLKIEPVPEKIVAPLVSAISSDSQRRKALANLEAVGLPALPAAKKLLASLPEGRAAYKEVESLAARLRTTVQEVSIAPDSRPVPADLRRKFESWEGKRVTAEGIVDAVLTTVDKLPADAFGIHVALEHPGDDTGLTLIVTLAELRPLSARGREKNWQSYEAVRVGGKKTHGRTCCTYKAFTPDELKEFTEALRGALAAPPRESLSVRFGVAVDRK
jgi:hypothetical protein